jgi:hypothetical protein
VSGVVQLFRLFQERRRKLRTVREALSNGSYRSEQIDAVLVAYEMFLRGTSHERS